MRITHVLVYTINYIRRNVCITHAYKILKCTYTLLFLSLNMYFTSYIYTAEQK